MPVADTTSPSGVTALIPGVFVDQVPSVRPAFDEDHVAEKQLGELAIGVRAKAGDECLHTPPACDPGGLHGAVGAVCSDQRDAPQSPGLEGRGDVAHRRSLVCRERVFPHTEGGINGRRHVFGDGEPLHDRSEHPGAAAARVLASGSPSPASADSMASRRAPALSTSMVAARARSAASSHRAWDADRVSEADS